MDHAEMAKLMGEIEFCLFNNQSNNALKINSCEDFLIEKYIIYY